MKITEESKKKRSEARKKFLSENPDKHPWKRTSNKPGSPVENIKSWLSKRNINFVCEFSPLVDRYFSIDIAFPEYKVGIEVNGNQHYNPDGTLKDYYQERHDLIESDGWKLLEIHYSLCYNEQNFNKIFDFSFDHASIYKNVVDAREQRRIEKEAKLLLAKLERLSRPKELKPVIKRKAKRKPGALDRGQKVKLASNKKWELIKDEIFNHQIDFAKFGWVQRVSDIIQISPQKVSSWMQKYHTEFYNTSCFKRKTSV